MRSFLVVASLLAGINVVLGCEDPSQSHDGTSNINGSVTRDPGKPSTDQVEEDPGYQQQRSDDGATEETVNPCDGIIVAPKYMQYEAYGELFVEKLPEGDTCAVTYSGSGTAYGGVLYGTEFPLTVEVEGHVLETWVDEETGILYQHVWSADFTPEEGGSDYTLSYIPVP
ncbi:MAG: hypothetical protein UY92_C0008G0021 [Candidatus Magasanikbacteria bacterium GW2011_GWA2_56_11]|uniref:Lipoprotein n=1 Tax=Candidatus Magasanikbacteria bacterium GW2011_GWA2_56_11 TaxID=1619044 RepID=A0A0G1YGJ6_9BACT|nr:MAG: hypothetical protein UY92_C0008G0021 [Candidatus Magasanikbacteria bacterium GW2011_GWA2_56_11]